jgi:hypothetical protein
MPMLRVLPVLTQITPSSRPRKTQLKVSVIEINYVLAFILNHDF